NENLKIKTKKKNPKSLLSKIMSASLEAWSIFVITAFCLIFFVGFVGNLLVLYAFRFMKTANRTRYSTHSITSSRDFGLTPMERLITYLAAIDLTASICNPLMYIYYEVTRWNRWDFGSPGCLIAGSVNSVLDTISCGLIVTIMVERCIVLRSPFKHNFNRNSVRKAFASVIFVSIILELPYMVHLKVYEDSSAEYKCSLDNSSEFLHQSQSYTNSTTFTAVPKHLSISSNGMDCNLNAKTTIKFTNMNSSGNYREGAPALCNKIPNIKTFPSKCNQIVSNSNSTETISPIFANIKCEIKTCTQNYHTCAPDGTKTYLYFKLFFIGIRDVSFISIFGICIYLIYGDMKNQKEALEGQCLTNARKTLKMLVLLSVIFGVLVLPKDIFQFAHNISILVKKELNRTISLKIHSFLKVLQCSNCISNVFVYARLHTKFRVRMKELTSNISENISNQYKGIPQLISHNNKGLGETLM
uniref:G-protein coupled receptors family 1 profile domain-containing protein n=1 Tax=Clytia hemisphaerica TaxID=252671 RepID=A0A7M5XB89_9CNID